MFHSPTLPFVLLVAIVYGSLGYTDVVAAAAEASMMLAINQIKEMPDYAEKGEVYVCTCK